LSGAAEDAGQERVWREDPLTRPLQRFWLGLLAPFAPEELL
jgi:hypothetical protein